VTQACVPAQAVSAFYALNGRFPDLASNAIMFTSVSFSNELSKAQPKVKISQVAARSSAEMTPISFLPVLPPSPFLSSLGMPRTPSRPGGFWSFGPRQKKALVGRMRIWLGV
jgi:hypothetical protein